jgi:hypothetical protein
VAIGDSLTVGTGCLSYHSRMSFMWADTLLSAERAHLLRLFIWGASSVLAGTALLAWLRARRQPSGLLEHFAMQTSAWGVIEVAFAAIGWRSLAARDLAAATRLDRLLWMNVGLDVGYILVGATLAIVGWRLGRRLGVVGAGTGVVVQGTALVLLDLLLTSQISR